MNRPGFAGLLRRRGFLSLLITQGLAVFVDQALKAVLLFHLQRRLPAEQASGWIVLGWVMVLLPLILLSPYAGQLADRISKRLLIIGASFAEVAILMAAVVALRAADLRSLLVVVFLMSIPAVLLSPARLGILPELLPEEELARANGLMELAAYTSVVLGWVAGAFLFSLFPKESWTAAGVLVFPAATAAALSLEVEPAPPADPQRALRWNPLGEFWTNWVSIRSWRPMALAVAGLGYFWFLGAFLFAHATDYGRDLLGLPDPELALLKGGILLGVGLGAILAGKLSEEKAELGLVPLGSLGLAVFASLLALGPWFPADSRLPVVVAGHLLLGISGGLYLVPLNTFLQQHAEPAARGRIIAAANVLCFLAASLAGGILYLLRGPLAVRPDIVLVTAGAGTLAATAYILRLLPDATARLFLWLLTHTFYRIRVQGRENLPRKGGALLVCNHVSYVDPFLIGACTQRYIRFLVHRPFYHAPRIHWLARLMGAIPIAAGDSPAESLASLRQAQQQMQQGELVCLFAEGSITRIGNLLPFRKGLERLSGNTGVPIIPLHLDRVWGSILSYEQGRFRFKWPRRIPYPVTVSIGQPLSPAAKAFEVRQAVMDLAADAMAARLEARPPLPAWFLNTACRNRRRFAMADSTGAEMNFAAALAGALLFRKLVGRQCRNQQMVGVLLPPGVPAALLNLGIALAGKVSVNLNYTASQEILQSCAQRCRLQTIYTARKFLERLNWEAQPGMVLLEDVRARITSLQKAFYGALAWAAPRPLLRLLFCRRPASLQELSTVIFSSGSTGTPKGVLLTHGNLLSNVEGLQQTLHLDRNDRLLGVLPFFHSFGLTGGLWMPLLSGIGVIYHFNPLDARTVGELASRHNATILIGTPTFYQAYLQRVPREQFQTLRLALAGAEKLQPRLAAAFRDKYDLELLEGYGCTELSPVVSVNVPSYEEAGETQVGAKPGAIGLPLPGVTVRIVDPETFEPRPVGEEGMLLVRGANVMKGYLDDPHQTAEVIRDGWYVTGDLARLDEDGFLTITDRLSRFSKIGGEMVPHGKLEEALHKAIETAESKFVVTSIPHPQKGERLVVLHLELEISIEEILQRLRSQRLPNLWIPRRENFIRVDAIPQLGSGKLDLRRARQIAQEQGLG